MTLIKSISGIRGIIGTGLTPVEIARFTAAYAALAREKKGEGRLKMVIGRDARMTGEMVSRVVSGTLMGCGCDVIDLGLATTPTVEMAVTGSGADAGIIITASHNPAEWNALKLLNDRGEFISAADGKRLLEMVDGGTHGSVPAENMGNYVTEEHWLDYHIERILALSLVDVPAIRRAGFRVAFDAVNSVGGIAIPALLEALGVSEVIPVNALPDGRFAHNPEPLPEHLSGLMTTVVQSGANVGFAVDPDVDRLAIVQEDGGYFGEEYTLVAVADYVLHKKTGNTVSNLSSTKALSDITQKHGGQYFASAVGEVNVVEMMKTSQAVIGGEGNGGVILPELHYGRDALVGIALILSHLATSGLTCSMLRKRYPDYVMSKNKLSLVPGTDMKNLFKHLKSRYSGYALNDADGLRIDFADGWVHLRASNTEPVMRVYAEGENREQADGYARQVMDELLSSGC